jgi:hypothetical protein
VASIGLAMLVAGARQPFSALDAVPYTAFSAPLAVLVCWTLLTRLSRAVPLMAAAGLSLSAVAAARTVSIYHEAPRRLVTTPRGTLSLLEPEARLLDDLLEALRTRTPPSSYVAPFPDAGLVLFLAERRSPLPYDQFLPGNLDERAEEEALRALDERPPAAAFVTNRSFWEFGSARFGEGYDAKLFGGLQQRLAPAGVLGAPNAPPLRLLRSSQALLFVDARYGKIPSSM